MRPALFPGRRLGPDNVEGAVERLHPYAVDVSSGIETDGGKDPEKMAAFVAAVRKGAKSMTNPKGRFGVHGGQYIPETLMNAVIELEKAYEHYKKRSGI